jgi:hypothetical protein
VGSPDLKLTEDRCAILKRRVEGLGPEAKEKLIDVIIVIIVAWEGIEMSVVNKLVDSMIILIVFPVSIMMLLK